MFNERNTCVKTRKIMHFTQFEQKIIFCDICINFLDYWCIFKEIGHIFSILAYLKLAFAGKQGTGGVRIKLNWRNIKLGPLFMNFGMSWLTGVHVVNLPILTKSLSFCHWFIIEHPTLCFLLPYTPRTPKGVWFFKFVIADNLD